MVGTVLIPILQMWKLRLTEVTELTQTFRIRGKQSWDWGQVHVQPSTFPPLPPRPVVQSLRLEENHRVCCVLEALTKS